MRSKILLVTADDFVFDDVQRAIDQDSFSVQAISAGKGFLETFNQVKPAILLIDWQLPDLSGMAVLRQVVENGHQNHTSIIMIGFDVPPDQRVLALELGADLCLSIPLEPNVFNARLRSLLRRTDLSDRGE